MMMMQVPQIHVPFFCMKIEFEWLCFWFFPFFPFFFSLFFFPFFFFFFILILILIFKLGKQVISLSGCGDRLIDK